MLFNCFREYQDVVQVNHYNPFHNELLKDVIHHGLEGGWAIGEPEKHHQWFEESPICSEGSFPLISFLHLDIIEAPPDIQFSEVLGTTKLCDEFRDKGKRILVFNCDRIKGSGVLNELEASILLFDEKDGRCHQGF